MGVTPAQGRAMRQRQVDATFERHGGEAWQKFSQLSGRQATLLELAGAANTNRNGVRLDSAAALFSDLDLVAESARAHISSLAKSAPQEVRHRITSPVLLTTTMASPWYLAIAASAPVAGLMFYILKHPEQIGSWLPRLGAGWYDGRLQLDLARRAYQQNIAVSQSAIDVERAALQVRSGPLRELETRSSEPPQDPDEDSGPSA